MITVLLVLIALAIVLRGIIYIRGARERFNLWLWRHRDDLR